MNNLALVKHCKKALDERWGYVWGTFGNTLTMDLLKYKVKQYPSGVGNHISFIKHNWMNRRTADCVGLIKSYLWWEGGYANYNPKTDVSADGMIDKAKIKGPMSTFYKNKRPGVCLWKKGHIGVYIGGGLVIEARSTTRGVIESPVYGYGASDWTHWLECPFIEYKNVLPEFKPWNEIIDEVSKGSYENWKKAIYAASNAAEAEGNIGDLEVFKFLPQLIEKIYNKNVTDGIRFHSWEKVVEEVSTSNAQQWKDGITTVLEVVKANGNVGEIEIFQFLPKLIQNICIKYS